MGGDKRRLVVGFVVALISGCTHAPWHPYRGWRAWKTANVTVYADTISAPTLTQQWMEETYQVFEASFFRGFDVPTVEVIEVQPGADSPFVTGDGTKKLQVAVPRLKVGPGPPRSVLLVGGKSDVWQQVHVLAHHFVEAAIPGAPLWFHEGMADYLMGFRQSERNPEIMCFGVRRPGRVTGIIEPLPKLFELTWADYNDWSAPRMGFTAWGLVDYLLHGRDRQLVPEFRSLMIALGQKHTGYGALRAAYPGDVVTGIDNDMADHVRRVEEPSLCPLPYRLGTVRRPPVPATVSDVPEETMRSFFTALEALPARSGYADFFP
jgi:hypothetical protein